MPIRRGNQHLKPLQKEMLLLVLWIPYPSCYSGSVYTQVPEYPGTRVTRAFQKNFKQCGSSVMILLQIVFEIHRLENGGTKFKFFEDRFGFLRPQ